MINRVALLSDLQKVLKRLEADLLERSESVDVPEVGKTLRAEYNRARSAERTAQNYEDWRTDAITQAAVAWVLSCVFVRFLEDNRLIDPPKISGPEDRLVRARDEWELYLSKAQQPNERDYLLSVFEQLAKLPGTKDVFGDHNPIRELPNWLSGDGAKQLLDFFQMIDANTGALVHDFTDANWDTRFLGDLYQDLSEAARDKFALLQTPEFVEEFILDRTLEPALEEFGLEQEIAPAEQRRLPGLEDRDRLHSRFKMIDPACGSGHFLLGTFRRILERWQRKQPGTNVRELVQRTLESIHGVDLNPFAIAIARFRLLLAAIRACNVTRLVDAPSFRMNLACGDSLLHAPLKGGQLVLDHDLTRDDDDCDHAYQAENLPLLKRILNGKQYHTVVANPPYIVPKDRQLSNRYRKRFASCHMKYSLAVPFLERIFKLGIVGGYNGQITANSFMKREFGKKLVESFFPTVDLTHVIDTQLTHIPGHGTPTVILLGRHRPPVASQVRLAGAIKREDEEPLEPAKGLVWRAIVDQIDFPGSQSDFISVSDSPRDPLHKHPWSIGGGGAAELKEFLEERNAAKLKAEAIGITAVTGEDELYMQPVDSLKRRGVELNRRLVVGDVVRDWLIEAGESSLWLYDDRLALISLEDLPQTSRLMWNYRAAISRRRRFGTPMIERGFAWYEWQELYRDKLNSPILIVFCAVATHNHFVLDRGGKVFKQTAPVIKLKSDATEDAHYRLLGLLNSSTGGFWIKQVCHCKGGGGIGGGIAAESWERFFDFNGTKLHQFPIPRVCSGDLDSEVGSVKADSQPHENCLIRFTMQLDALGRQRQCSLPASILESFVHTQTTLAISRATADEIMGQMFAIQEELDWECYRLYGLISQDLTHLEPPALKLGQRAFEIVLAGKLAAGDIQTTWFERHSSNPITELPAEWPDDYRQLVERRIALIENDPKIRLIEQPEYKRRWNTESWDSQLERALREWLLTRLEGCFDFDGRINAVDRPTAKIEISIVSSAKLADFARQDAEFQKVGAVYRDDPAFDVQTLVSELVAAESVPLLPVLRYKPSGLINRGTWERTWGLQRQEDVIDARTKLSISDPEFLSGDAARDLKQVQVGNIPVPTKYDAKDFLDSNLWRLRGKLDVPKERWISFPHCEGPDGTIVVCWAGYDHLQQAQAISAYYVRVQTEFGGTDDPRLIPLLACLIELLPWLKQWHNEPDANFDGMRMGDYFEGFVNEEARQLNKTIPEIKAWTPRKKVAKGQTGKRTKRGKKKEEGEV